MSETQRDNYLVHVHYKSRTDGFTKKRAFFVPHQLNSQSALNAVVDSNASNGLHGLEILEVTIRLYENERVIELNAVNYSEEAV